MSIRELTCPTHGHPVGPDDAYCGACGAVLSIGPAGFRPAWPQLVPDPDTAAQPATITPIRPEVEFRPLDFSQAASHSHRRAVLLTLAALVTAACVALLALSEIRLGEGADRAFWVVMWLASYGATVVAAAGWVFAFILWMRRGEGGATAPARRSPASTG